MKNEINTDHKLWQEIRANNEKALSIVFDIYFHRLSHFAHSMVKDTEAAEDIVSEVFVKLWLNRHKTKLTTGLKPYLFAAAKNTSLNYLRSTKQNLSIEDVAEKDIISNVSADSILVHNEVLSEFQELLSTMSPQQSMVIKLHKLEGLSQKEVADKLSISLKTVQNHIYLAMKFISEKLASKKYDFYFLLLMLLPIIG
uniref:RNA polymerase sigma factor n=1 Tax=uncultured Draconibacterium sp. TaxID=1573823 RepID=UPI00321667E0